jgi:hypothetical protein
MDDRIEKVWGRRPAVLPGAANDLVATDARLFDVLVAASDEARGQAESPALRLYLERSRPGGSDALRLETPQPHLPRRSDGGLDGYARRLVRSFRGHRFGLVFNDLEAYDWQHWLAMRGFLDRLESRVGRLAPDASTTLFVGNYRHTPFGIHKDELHVFTFVVRGTKRMRVWPFETFVGRGEVTAAAHDQRARIPAPSTAERRAALSRSALLAGARGDLLYWPASCWHCSEPSPGLTVTIALAARPAGPPVARVPSAERVRAKSRGPLRSRPPGRAALLPARFSHVTLSDPGRRLVLARRRGDLLVSGNGFLISVADRRAVPRVVALVRRLNGGRPVPVGRAAGRLVGSLLEHFYRWRSIEVAPASSASRSAIRSRSRKKPR